MLVKNAYCFLVPGDLNPQSVKALQAGDQLFGEGFAGFGPEEAAGDAAVFLDREGERKEHLDVLLNALLRGLVEVGVFEGVVEDPGGVEAEVDADVPVLFIGGLVEHGAEAEDLDGGWLGEPKGVECGGPFGIFGGPEAPLHLELVGHIVVELLGSLSNGVVDDGVLGGLGAVIIDVDTLVDGCFVEGDGVNGGRGDSLGFWTGDGCELAEDADELAGQAVKAEVGKPEA